METETRKMNQYKIYLADGQSCSFFACKAYITDDALMFTGERGEPVCGYVKGMWTRFEIVQEEE